VSPLPKATVLACSTAKDDKQPTQIPITRRAGARPLVVMTLAPGGPKYSKMPDLVPGDRLEVSAELELTTDAADSRDAVAKPYGYSPQIRASLLLADDGKETNARHARQLVSSRETCDHRQHHHRVVFDVPHYTVRPGDVGSHLNFVLSAHCRTARDGQILLIGQNEPPEDGRPASVKGRMGKLNVVRYRGQGEPPHRFRKADSARRTHLRVQKGDPKVVYSLRLMNLKEGEQLVLEARLVVNNSHSYPVRVATQVILSHSHTGIEPLHGDARKLATFSGEIAKYNGTNAMPRGPCTTRKFGTLRMLEDAGKKHPLFVNLVAACGDPERQAKTNDTIKVEPGGYLHIRRFPPSVAG
jgi:hypothetical protein